MSPGGRPMRTALSLTTTFALVSVGLAGCGVPTTGEFEAISREAVQFELDATSTTTTSTIPPTTIDATSTTALETTTTISTEDVLIFFVAGSQLNPVTIPLARPASPSQVMAKLLEGPRSLGDVGTGLRSAIPAGADITVSKVSGVGVIDLPPDIFDSMPTRDQRLLYAQLVLTIGRLGGIGPVRFTLGGEPARVVRGDGSVTEPGETVTVDDYAILLTGQAPPETTLGPATETTAAEPITPTEPTP
ncbi:MAG: hypothetical protein RI958_2691 [Actinomycetota bacterium]|jgi:hypothetical protein